MCIVVVRPMIRYFPPWMVAIAIAIKRGNRGAALFGQGGIGRGNRLFRMYKFRSMRVERSDATGTTSTSRYDERVTQVGRWMRATSMAELPQLANGMMGSMTLVGLMPNARGSTGGEKPFGGAARPP